MAACFTATSYMSANLSDERAYSSCTSAYIFGTNRALTLIGGGITQLDNKRQKNINQSYETGQSAGFLSALPVFFALRSSVVRRCA